MTEITQLTGQAFWLPVIFIGLMRVAFFIYAILDGYDLGVGILLPNDSEQQRELPIATPQPQDNKLWPMEKAMQLGGRVVSLSEDRNGEIYVLTHEGMGPFGNTGKVFRLVAGQP